MVSPFPGLDFEKRLTTLEIFTPPRPFAGHIIEQKGFGIKPRMNRIDPRRDTQADMISQLTESTCGSTASLRVVFVSDKFGKEYAGHSVYRPFREPMLLDIRADGRPRFPEVSGRFRAGYKDHGDVHIVISWLQLL